MPESDEKPLRINQLWSRPLSVNAWARFFGLRWDSTKRLLIRYGAEEFERRYSLPLGRCPPAYFHYEGFEVTFTRDATYLVPMVPGSRID